MLIYYSASSFRKRKERRSSSPEDLRRQRVCDLQAYGPTGPGSGHAVRANSLWKIMIRNEGARRLPSRCRTL